MQKSRVEGKELNIIQPIKVKNHSNTLKLERGSVLAYQIQQHQNTNANLNPSNKLSGTNSPINIVSKSPIVERKDSKMQVARQGKNKQSSLDSQGSTNRQQEHPSTQANTVLQKPAEASVDEKEGKLTESAQKSRLGKNNSKVNILIHSSQVSSISNPS